MNRFILIPGALLLALSGAAPAETLREAIVIAYAGNPQLAAARARQEAMTELPEQARSLRRVTATAEGSAGYDRLDYGKAAFGSAGVRLPIWTGGRASSALRVAESEVAASSEELRDAEATILQAVVTAYATMLFNQQAVEVARVGLQRLDQQLVETQSRFDLGQATRTDVAQLEAQRASVSAALVEAEGALAIAAAAYRAVVGKAPAALSPEVGPLRGMPASVDEAHQAALSNNPLVLRQRRIAEASEARVEQAQAEGAPSFDLVGGYGRGGRFVGGAIRGFEGAASAGLSFRLPLLTGGLVPSRVRQAQAVGRAERLQTEAEAWEATRSTDAAWAALSSAGARLRANAEGLTAAQLALNGVRAEYAFGLRSTIDILLADQTLRAAQLAVAASRSDVLVAQASLLRATGRLNVGAFL